MFVFPLGIGAILKEEIGIFAVSFQNNSIGHCRLGTVIQAPIFLCPSAFRFCVVYTFFFYAFLKMKSGFNYQDAVAT